MGHSEKTSISIWGGIINFFFFHNEYESVGEKMPILGYVTYAQLFPYLYILFCNSVKRIFISNNKGH